VIAAVPAHPPARVQIVAREFSLAPSRAAINAGKATIELANFGEDPHDLRLQRVGGTKIYGWPVALPGVVEDRTLTLAPGRYRLWCSLGNHRALGMLATLVVRAPKP
jgi:plastocyanin